jgi:hypothetical protein
LVSTLTELIAIAALASTGSSISPATAYRAPAATGKMVALPSTCDTQDRVAVGTSPQAWGILEAG